LNRQGIGRGGRLRAAFATLLALSLLGSLALAQTAGAATLSERVAVKQAARLMNKQLKDKERDLVEARVSVGERVNRNRFVFLYDDLNKEGVVCTATIDVRLTPPGGNTVVARFLKGAKCAAPGDEGLGFRAAARFAGVAFAKKERSVLRSVTRYIEQAQACEDLKVPDDRQDEAVLMLSTGLTQATIRPLSGTLDAYATTLQSLGVTDPQLAKGAAAWRDFVDGVRSLPKFSTSYCTVLAEWAANGYTDETAPVDFAALRALAVRLQGDGAEVRRTGRYLAKLGVDPVTVRAFSLDDLIGNTGLGNPSEDAVARTLKHYRQLAN
jgi:hypothetical protein